VFRRPSESGTAIELDAIDLPASEGATIPLGYFGEIGFATAAMLVRTAPRGAAAGCGRS